MSGGAGESRQSSARRRGVTLVEAVLSMVIVSVLLVSALNAAGQVWQSRQTAHDTMRGQPLADELLAEILDKAYADPDDPDRGIGLDPGESADDRGQFDDVDDYQGYAATPPEDGNGNPIESFDGWTRAVTVGFVADGSFGALTATDTGIKRIEVSVSHNGRPIASAFALRTSAWDPKAVPTDPADTPSTLLLVVRDAENLESEDIEVQSIAGELGYTVEIVEDADVTLAQANAADVVYMARRSQQGDLATEVRNTTTGMVLAERRHWDFFGLAQGIVSEDEDDLDLIDDAHAVADGFSIETLKVTNGKQTLYAVDGSLTNVQGADVIATLSKDSDAFAIVAAEEGAFVVNNRIAAGRRITIPWTDSSKLSADGKTLVNQIIEWAEGAR
ncbi:MAG: prepilin-type N-terminal cleavage/methylation domain-containing protein [Planctomycetota bacterium]